MVHIGHLLLTACPKHDLGEIGDIEMTMTNNTEMPNDDSEVKRSQALSIVLGYVTEKRTLIQFEVAEKFSKSYRIKADSWNHAQRRIEDEDLYIHNGWTEDDTSDYEDDPILEIDGSHQHIEEYKPTFARKVEHVKIGYRWYDMDRLRVSLLYYVSQDYNIRRTIDDNASKAVMIILKGGDE